MAHAYCVLQVEKGIILVYFEIILNGNSIQTLEYVHFKIFQCAWISIEGEFV